ncbi:hypothetical protein [Paraburkholderia silvatlantica]|uniref:hypothetical protein n=2 Tax=Paraburkholderia silvatlantica TaxID=321895 RepID=UPI000D5EE4F0|nr:hypothetical protein [Paraburkholderia silvatlantica]PVY27266.1 hypothetical protein C7411_12079 [Paraburkholderia silvatlantica]PXW34295.1 hypothetical protein C7413_11979 [Paraburkholderia silvatlantica]TDQ85190.1 hypothetical protein C7412_12079 [Paraburkholderia silvatlantica]
MASRWVPEYACAARVEWCGSQVIVRDVRNFRYRTREDYMPAYYDVTFALDAVTTVDLVVSRWSTEAIAHILRHVRAVSPDVGYSWKVLLSGFADRYGYDPGLLDVSIPFDALKSASLIRRPPGTAIDGDFSAATRASLPLVRALAK